MDASAQQEKKAPSRPLLERERRRRGMSLSIFEGMSAQAQTCCSGLGGGGPNAITTGFALLLGAKDPELGLLAALPVYGNLVQYAAAALSTRTARKPIVAVSATIARVSFLGVGLLPFLLDRPLALKVFLAIWLVTNALMSLSGNLWVSWMADLVPPGVRGRYFSRRNRATSIASVLVPLAASFVLARWFGGVPRDGLGDPALGALQARGFAVVFGASAFFGVVCGFLLAKQPEPTLEREPRPLDLAWFLGPFRDRAFWPLLAFVAAFGAANGLANPFWTPFQLQELHLGYVYVNGWFVVTQGVTMILSLKLWGRLADRFGTRPVIALCLVLVCSHPWYYVFANQSRWWLMFFDAASSGLAWAGYNLALFNLVLALAPRGQREVYYATQAVVIGLSQATFSVLAGSYASQLPRVFSLLGLGLDPRQQIFLATGVARLGCLAFFLAAVFEPRKTPIRTFVVAVGAFVKARLNIKFMTIDD